MREKGKKNRKGNELKGENRNHQEKVSSFAFSSLTSRMSVQVSLSPPPKKMVSQ